MIRGTKNAANKSATTREAKLTVRSAEARSTRTSTRPRFANLEREPGGEPRRCVRSGNGYGNATAPALMDATSVPSTMP
ncbi:hypothetical protein NOGI109294_06985 [Nocardiopsis gilva]